MLMVGHLGMGMGWQIPEELWSRVAPLLKLSNKCLIGFSLVQVPPIWLLASGHRPERLSSSNHPIYDSDAIHRRMTDANKQRSVARWRFSLFHHAPAPCRV